LIRAGEITPQELIQATITRIKRLNPALNAVITPLYHQARAQAAGSPPSDAPFWGVPLLLKDAVLEVAGTPYYVGTQVLKEVGWTSTRDTWLAARFRQAGFIFIGKTNVPELSSGITTEPQAFGPTRNPWDVTHTAGGSSGGSAAAVAAGLTSVAHGGDGGGSLRYPATCCGVATLKPSRGRLVHETMGSGLPDVQGWWVDFVLARTLRDLAGVLRRCGCGKPSWRAIPGSATSSPVYSRAWRLARTAPYWLTTVRSNGSFPC
jgi:amidase